MRFEFATATRIYFGVGLSADIGKISAQFGERVVFVGHSDRYQEILSALEAHGITIHTLTPDGEPTVEIVSQGVALVRNTKAEFVIGCGGGSAIDLAKAAAILAVHEGEPLDYVEVIGRGQTLTKPSLPVIAVPTTAGTGSEVTANAVVSSHEQQVKVSLRSPHMLPRAAVIDPALTLTLPKQPTAFTGMDALTQVIEPYVSNKANPITDSLCLEGISRAGQSLKRAFDQPDDLDARTDMSLTALLSGMALANSKLGAVHGFAGVIGGMTEAPHGAICAALLSPVISANIEAIRTREPEHRALERYQEIAMLLTNNPDATPEDGATRVAELASDLEIPRLSALGVQQVDIPTIVERSAGTSSMQGNPIKLTPEELTAILENAL